MRSKFGLLISGGEVNRLPIKFSRPLRSVIAAVGEIGAKSRSTLTFISFHLSIVLSIKLTVTLYGSFISYPTLIYSFR